MTAIPTVDESFAQLHRAAWSVGDARILTAAGAVWQGDATNGGHGIIARAPSQAQVWHLPSEQAEALGMLGRGQ
jgi:hypothetical protein